MWLRPPFILAGSFEDLIPVRSISEEIYLRTIDRTDCDDADGRVEERNAGEFGHRQVQHTLDRISGNHEPGMPLHVSASKYLDCWGKVRRFKVGIADFFSVTDGNGGV